MCLFVRSFVRYLVFGKFVYFASKELKGFSGKRLFNYFFFNTPFTQIDRFYMKTMTGVLL